MELQKCFRATVQLAPSLDVGPVPTVDLLLPVCGEPRSYHV